MIPLQRALHQDRKKLAVLTNNDPDMKATNPALLTRIRNQQANTIIPSLPVMQGDILSKFIQMLWCITLDFSGTGKKADAVHPSHFLKFDANGDLSTFKNIGDFIQFVDNIQAVCMAVFMEDKKSIPFFSRIFLLLRDKFRDTSLDRSVEHLNCNFMAYNLALMFNEWAQLYTNGANINATHEEFLQMNLAVLDFDEIEWQQRCKSKDMSKVPNQQVTPKAAKSLPATTAGSPRTKGNKHKLGGKAAPPAPKRQKTSAPTQAGSGAPAAAVQQGRGANKGKQATMCLKHILHEKDPLEFPAQCVNAPCHRSHATQLQGGKFSAQDKTAALGILANPRGTFETKAKQYIIANM